jgi:hypothetical protein
MAYGMEIDVKSKPAARPRSRAMEYEMLEVLAMEDSERD